MWSQEVFICLILCREDPRNGFQAAAQTILHVKHKKRAVEGESQSLSVKINKEIKMHALWLWTFFSGEAPVEPQTGNAAAGRAGSDHIRMNTSYPAAMFMTWIIIQKCLTGGQNEPSGPFCSLSKSSWRAWTNASALMVFWLPFEFLFILCLIGVCVCFFASSFSSLIRTALSFLPLSMNLWLWEKALKEGLARVNGGQLCQLLHPNEAALSFTKPQLITLQAISEQDCLSASHFSIPFSPQSTT